MSKKQLSNRLENLFATLEPEEALIQEPAPLPSKAALPAQLTGWSWECDGDGVLLKCGPEAAALLGCSPIEMLGQRLDAFRLTKPSATRLKKIFRKDSFPVEVDLEYQRAGGGRLPVRMHIFAYPSDNPDEGGYHGLVQILPEEEETTPELPALLDFVPELPDPLPPSARPTPAPQPEPFPLHEVLPVERPLTPAERQPKVRLDLPGAATESLTPAGLESLATNQPVLQPAVPGKLPAAVALPFRLNNHPAGVIELLDENPNRVWTEEERLLIEEVAKQLDLALENVQLYTAVQQELEVRVRAEREIRLRERYQKNVAQAVSTLSELGTLALADFLRFLGDASEADRIGYYEVLQDEHGAAYWSRNLEWCADGIQSSTGNPRLYVSQHAVLANALSENSLYSADTRQLRGPAGDQLASAGIVSFLSIAVAGKNATPGMIRFESLSSGREWAAEEIQALQLASAGLANTLVREDLLGQLESSLDETESLYNASRKLAVAGDLQSMLAAILEGLPIAGMNRAELVSIGMTVTGQVEKIEVTANWYSGQSNPPALMGSQLSASLFGPLMSSSQPVFLNDVQGDSNLSLALRTLLSEEGTAALAVLPLWVGRRQIGALLLKSDRTGVFTDRDSRSYPPLVGQMAIAIENLRLLEQTQVALEETESLYQASADLNVANTYAEVLEVLRRYTIIGEGAHAVNLSFFNVPWSPEKAPEFVETQARWSQDPSLTFRSRYPLALLSSAFQMLRPDGPVLVEDIPTEPRLDESTRRLYSDDFKAVSAMFFPIVVGGQWMGFINSMYPVRTFFPEAEIRRTMSLVSQAAVAVQNLKNIAATQQRAEEALLLFNASQALTQARSEAEMFSVVLDAAANNIQLNSATIHLMVTDGGKPFLEQAAHRIDKGMPTPDNGSRYPARLFPFADMLLVGQSAVSANALQDPRLTEIARKYIASLDLSTVAAIPLRVRGQTIGALMVARKHSQNFEPSEITFLESLGVQLGIAMDNVRLLNEAQSSAQEAHQRSEELALINRVVSSVASSLELRAGLQVVIEELGKTFSLASGTIALLNDDQHNLTIMADYAPGSQSAVGMTVPLEGNPSTQLVFTTRKPVIITDAQHDPRTRSIQDMLVWRGIHTLVILPLVTGKDVIGTVTLDLSEPGRTFTEGELGLAETIVFQAATAIQNAHLFEQTQTALAETELLYRVSRSISQAVSAGELLDLVFDTALPGTAHRVTFLLLHHTAAGHVHEAEMIGSRERGSTYHQENYRISSQAFPLMTSLRSDPIYVADTALGDLDPATRLFFNQLKMRTVCLVPFRSAGRVTGLMLVSSAQPVEFAQKEIRLLQITGDGIAVALEKQRLLQEAQRRALELQTAAEIARDTSGTLDLDTMLNRIVNMLCERFGFYQASIFLRDDSGQYAVIREATGEAGAEMKARGHRLTIGSRSIIGTVMSTAQPVVVNDVSTSDIHRPNPLLPHTRSELGIPLRLNDQVIGALDVQSTQANAFHADDITVLEILADQIAVAIENTRAYELSQKAVEEMREVDRVKSQFLANMSHELRTPLNSIIGFSRVILKGIDGPITDIQQQDLSAIYNSGQHLLRLINDILDLSKIEAGKMELAIDDVDVSDIVSSVFPTASGLVKDKPIKLVKQVAEGLPTVRADTMRVRQVLINLLSNAAKFTDEGNITVSAEIQPAPNGGSEVIFRVIDSGPGIALEDQRKLFQPFSQVDDSPTRKTGGTGLGLSICRSLIEMHGGRIGLESSEIGRGSTFFFTLPLVTPEKQTGQLSLTGPLVMCIDDDPQVISLYERYLGPQGYQVVAVTDPLQAVAQARALKPFAITLDVMMPNRDGWRVIQDLKNDIETRDIPVIMCTILEDEEKGFSLGATDYLVKPILQEDMVSAFNRLNADGKIRNVLVIDDDPDDLRLMQKILEQNQAFKVSLANGGLQGWEMLSAQPPDAIIMDLFMPDLNGFALLEKLRADKTLQDIPVIVLTGADLTAEQHTQLTAFGQDMLAKGLLKENELLSSLDRALKHYRPKE